MRRYPGGTTRKGDPVKAKRGINKNGHLAGNPFVLQVITQAGIAAFKAVVLWSVLRSKMSTTVPSAWLEREYLALYDRRVGGNVAAAVSCRAFAVRDTILPKNRCF